MELQQCLLTYRLQTRAGPVSLTYQKRVSFSQTLHPACGPSYSTTTSLTLLFSHNHSDKPYSDRCNITFVVTKLQTRLSQGYKWRTLPDALGPTSFCKWSSVLSSFHFVHLYILLGQTWAWLYETMPKHAACLIIYIVTHEYNAKSEHFVSLSVVRAEFTSLLDETARDVLMQFRNNLGTISWSHTQTQHVSHSCCHFTDNSQVYHNCDSSPLLSGAQRHQIVSYFQQQMKIPTPL